MVLQPQPTALGVAPGRCPPGKVTTPGDAMTAESFRLLPQHAALITASGIADAVVEYERTSPRGHDLHPRRPRERGV